MIKVEDLEQLSKNRAIVSKLHSGEITSTEVDLSELSDIEKIECYKYIQRLNQWAAPEWSKLDSDYVYSKKQNGYYRCNFRKAAKEIEFENEINRQFEELVKDINKTPWYRYLANLVRDNFVLSILILILSFFGLDLFIGIKEMLAALKEMVLG
ncbi:hypothetical protein [Vibrio fluvialis]|uniref:hypothetical protein n=1 Tax=Vibrio fluvialis TaxID=676 RepID=UPI001C9CDD71|nr:hypothetical protein [Vibrio fluvialis]EKO3965176.1 hypothetical protein [Vibrio fluvialis]MBY8251552.1 hypothetical protein [Vibrio fluvialis]MCG6357688.1 hypothetical protein [Vibrio fluvialis]